MEVTETKTEHLIERIRNLKHLWRVAPAYEVKAITMFDSPCVIIEFKDSPIMHAVDTFEEDIKRHELHKGYALAKIVTKKNKALVMIPYKIPEKSPSDY